MNSFFVDECLTPDLVAFAHSRGYAATHVIFLQRDGAADLTLAQLVLDRNDVLVTNNARDFLAIYAEFDLHPGLVIILPNVSREEQLKLFDVALVTIEEQRDIINKVLIVERDGSTRMVPWSLLDRDRET